MACRGLLEKKIGGPAAAWLCKERHFTITTTTGPRIYICFAPGASSRTTSPRRQRMPVWFPSRIVNYSPRCQWIGLKDRICTLGSTGRPMTPDSPASVRESVDTGASVQYRSAIGQRRSKPPTFNAMPTAGKDHITNGLLLRADLHRLFNRRKISIDPRTGKDSLWTTPPRLLSERRHGASALSYPSVQAPG
jgi:hypothetical protein